MTCNKLMYKSFSSFFAINFLKIKKFIILFNIIIEYTLSSAEFRLLIIVLIQLIELLMNPSLLLILPYIFYNILSVLFSLTIMAINDPVMITFDFDLYLDLFNDCAISSEKIDIQSIKLNSFSGYSPYILLGIDNPFIEIKSLPSSSQGGLSGGSPGGLPGGSPGGLPGGSESLALVNQNYNDNNNNSEIIDSVMRNYNSSISVTNPEEIEQRNRESRIFRNYLREMSSSTTSQAASDMGSLNGSLVSTAYWINSGADSSYVNAYSNAYINSNERNSSNGWLSAVSGMSARSNIIWGQPILGYIRDLVDVDQNIFGKPDAIMNSNYIEGWSIRDLCISQPNYDHGNGFFLSKHIQSEYSVPETPYIIAKNIQNMDHRYVYFIGSDIISNPSYFYLDRNGEAIYIELGVQYYFYPLDRYNHDDVYNCIVTEPNRDSILLDNMTDIRQYIRNHKRWYFSISNSDLLNHNEDFFYDEADAHIFNYIKRKTEDYTRECAPYVHYDLHRYNEEESDT